MMDILKKIIRERWCKLRTGHQYRDSNLKCHVGPELVSYQNECLCCGKVSSWTIPLSALRADLRKAARNIAIPIDMDTQFVSNGKYINTPISPTAAKLAEQEAVEV